MPRATLRVVLVCALAVCAARAGDPDQRFNSRLAVQKALDDAQDHLKRGNYRDAVVLLEKHIAYIDGNRSYLVAMRDAYAGYVAQLKASVSTKVPTSVTAAPFRPSLAVTGAPCPAHLSCTLSASIVRSPFEPAAAVAVDDCGLSQASTAAATRSIAVPNDAGWLATSSAISRP